MQVEPLISRIRTSGLKVLQQLKVSKQFPNDELSSEHLEVDYSINLISNLRFPLQLGLYIHYMK
jgi:hypothetical protein